jgi:hypothetical protein
MPDTLMYEEEHFVVLIPGEAEEFLSAAEMLTKLQDLVSCYAAELPRDVARLPTALEQAQYLLNTSCELEIGPGKTVQWFAVRLEK